MYYLLVSDNRRGGYKHQNSESLDWICHLLQQSSGFGNYIWVLTGLFLWQCELYHWVDLLDRFDGILCDAGQTVENMSWLLVCDHPDNGQLKALLLAVLNFTALLIEYSFSRHLYSSIEVGWKISLLYSLFSLWIGWTVIKSITPFVVLLLPAAFNHLVSIMWHAGGPLCVEPALCVQQALQLHHETGIR